MPMVSRPDTSNAIDDGSGTSVMRSAPTVKPCQFSLLSTVNDSDVKVPVKRRMPLNS